MLRQLVSALNPGKFKPFFSHHFSFIYCPCSRQFWEEVLIVFLARVLIFLPVIGTSTLYCCLAAISIESRIYLFILNKIMA